MQSQKSKNEREMELIVGWEKLRKISNCGHYLTNIGIVMYKHISPKCQQLFFFYYYSFNRGFNRMFLSQSGVQVWICLQNVFLRDNMCLCVQTEKCVYLLATRNQTFPLSLFACCQWKYYGNVCCMYKLAIGKTSLEISVL